MTYTKIREEVEEILNLQLQTLSETVLEDNISRVQELAEMADKINETDEGDGEYTEIMELIEEIDFSFNEEISNREEEDYDY